MDIFDSVDKFFSSINSYLTYNEIFIICAGLFLFVVLCVLITTSRSYEAKLIKAVDMFNNYFLDSPQITDENLIAFNNRMKSRKVPKQLRKQWQQFVLYREEKASFYMSFENCVSTPLRNSSFTHSITVMNIMAYILAVISLILNIYCSYEGNLSSILQHVLLCPVLILLVNYLLTIFLNFRHSAIISDLNQNYQYFEVNVDKATKTLPEYVDYEVLFDKNEIKHGIPILYAYLEKRAEEEKKELERSRLKNIEHEKFNFDEEGIASALVLDRAMQEAENYINERKKCMEDMEQINSDITQEEMAYRETTKEYQRQLQVSKETFANFKQQLEEANSTIEANYIKKQQQQELDRQRNLERDFDTATDKHKKILETYQGELSAVEDTLKKAKSSLEKSMISEFRTYSGKVYDEMTKIVEEREQEKTDKLKGEIKNLEEKIVSKDTELDNVYDQNRAYAERMEANGIAFEPIYVPQPHEIINTENEPEDVQYAPEYQEEQYTEPNAQAYQEEPVEDYQEDQTEPQQEENLEPQLDANFEPQDEENNAPEEETFAEPVEETLPQDFEEEANPDEAFNVFDEGTVEEGEPAFNVPNEEADASFDDFESFNEPVEGNEISGENDLSENEDFLFQPDDEDAGEEGTPENFFTFDEDESEEPKRKAGRPRKNVAEIEEPKTEIKRRGRPKKVVEEETKPEEEKRGRGRPRKQEATEETQSAPATPAKRGRPRKEQPAEETAPNSEIEEPKRKAGRPRKVDTVEVAPVQEDKPAKRGRPRKEQPVEETTQNSEIEEPKKKAGRPSKDDTTEVESAQGDKPAKRGRPRKEQPAEETALNDTATEEPTQPEENGEKRGRGRPKKAVDATTTQTEIDEPKRGRGRPKKESASETENQVNLEPSQEDTETQPVDAEANVEDIQDIDGYLKQLDDEIAKENEKLAQTQKELEKKARISKRRK